MDAAVVMATMIPTKTTTPQTEQEINLMAVQKLWEASLYIKSDAIRLNKLVYEMSA